MMKITPFIATPLRHLVPTLHWRDRSQSDWPHHRGGPPRISAVAHLWSILSPRNLRPLL